MINPTVTPEILNTTGRNSMSGFLGIEFTEIGPDFVRAKMPVNERTRQPFGILHGGASAALAETLGSVASTLRLNLSEQYPVGLEINANHLKRVESGYVYGTAKAVHLGRRTHVWGIEIINEERRLVCVSRLTVMIVDKKTKK
jgi:1,4-dihydroxy-2-naphthoyl-CoA hydrolase